MTKAGKVDDGKSGATGGRRSAARLAAVQALYEMELAAVGAEAVLESFLEKRWQGVPLSDADDIRDIGDGSGKTPQLTAPDPQFLQSLVRGVSKKYRELDPAIAACLKDETPFDKLEPLIRAILRAAAYELVFRADVPARAVITEYVEVANAFFDDRKPQLINAVLDSLAKQVQAKQAQADEAVG